MTIAEFKKYMNNQIDTNMVSHSYLFCVENICEFQEILNEFLKNLILKNISLETEKARIGKLIDVGNLDEIQKIDGKNSKVADIRKLFSKIYEKPFFISKKIYIIENIEYLNNSSQNAMLKILEEPPEYVHILLISNTLNNILDTIKSRCQKIYLSDNYQAENQEQSQRIDEDKDIDNNFNVNNSDNSSNNNNNNNYNQFLNEIISIFEKQKLKEELTIDEIEKISAYMMIDNVFKYPKSVYYAKYSKNISKDNILRYIQFLEQVIYIKILQKKNMLIYSNMYKVLTEVKKKINFNCNFEMSKDILIFNIWDVANIFNN